MALLDNGQDLEVCAQEMGCEVGQLLTPLTRYTLRDPNGPWGMDNGCFKRFKKAAFLALLARELHHRTTCLFVAVPDVVGSARRTLEVFRYWAPQLEGWPLALVCQDGQEDLPIPWDEIEAVFIGGTTAWKLSLHVVQIIQTALILEKHVHVGRVNDPARWEYFDDLGADTGDGSGIAQYTHMRTAIRDRHAQPRMFA